MTLLSHSEFEARYGEIAARLFHIGRPACVRGRQPNLIFRRPPDWPAIPLPGDFDRMCRDVGEYEDLLEWLGFGAYGPFDDGAVSLLYSWFLDREARRLLWGPLIATLADRGSGKAALLEPQGRMVPAGKWADREGGWTLEGWREANATHGIEPAEYWATEWKLEDWRGAEDWIDGGLPLDFGDWRTSLGDVVCLIDETAAWAIHSWGEIEISYLTAEPALMERVLEAVGGPEIVGKFFLLDCATNPEIQGELESFLDFFRKSPFVEMPIRHMSTLSKHLEVHPWLDEAFFDLRG